MTPARARTIALALLGMGAGASAALATGRWLVLPGYGIPVLALFLIALLFVARDHALGRGLGILAVSALGLLSLLAVVASADPDTWQGVGVYPSDWLYLAVAFVAAYWITAVAALRRVGPSLRTGP